MTTRLPRGFSLSTLLLAGLLSGMGWMAVPGTAADFAMAPALSNPAPGDSKLVDLARNGSRLFAIGARGLIAFSDDGGTSWTQATVPVSGTLTAITFTPNGTGFAAGHGGVILRSTSAGESWELVFDGNDANAQFLDWATEKYARREQVLADLQAADELDAALIEEAEYELEEAGYAVDDAELAVETGPADPFLTILFIDDQVGIAMGAYGMAYRTEDGGDTWSISVDGIDNPDRYHFYSLVLDSNGRLFASGEAGLLFYSDDAGVNWTRVYDVYDGSLFALVTDNGAVYAVGLRGNVFRSTDGGVSWTNVPLQGSGSLYAGTGSDAGKLVLVGAGGRVVYSDDGGTTFTESVHPSRSGLANVMIDGERLLLASMSGFFVESLEDYDGN